MSRLKIALAVTAVSLLGITYAVNAPTASAVGDPHETSIQHSDDGSSTRVLVHGIGTAAAAAELEGRKYTHSDLQPAARFVARGQDISVDVPAGAPAMEVAIGLMGPYAAHNDGREVGYHRTALSAGTNVVTAPHDGMVSLVSTAAAGHVTATLTGGTAVPVFVRGESTNASFAEQMRRFGDAPFVEVVAERMFGDFQKPKTGAAIAADDLEARTANWDRVVELTNATYGLVDGAVGTSRKHPHRIHIVSPDTGAGFANATSTRIMFQVDTGAARELFAEAPAAQWALWHEIGHTYEAPINLFPGTSETVTNLSSLAVQDGLGFGSRWDESVRDFEAYFASDDRDWLTAHDRIRLLAWEQLRRAFGDGYMPRFFQALRVEAALTNLNVLTTEDKHALFVRTASRIADRNLEPFYDALGFPMSDATRSTIAVHPDLDQRIWDNVDSRERVIEHEIPAYDPPVGVVSDSVPDVPLGRWNLPAPEVGGLGTVSGRGTATAAGAIGIADTVGAGAAQLAVVLRSSNGSEDAIVVRADSVGGNAVLARGQGNRVVGSLAVDGAEERLRWRAVTSYKSHTSWAERDYLTIAHLDTDGSEIAAASVRGDQTGAVLNDVFGDRPYRDGQFLLVAHQEPALLAAYRDSASVQDGGVPQAFRLVDGRLEPIDREDIPGWQPIRPAEAPATDLNRGADTAVPTTLSVHARITRISGTVTVTAPEGTTFAAGQTTLPGSYRAPGGTWTSSANLVLRGGVRSADGATMTYGLATGSGFRQEPGALLRWSPVISTPADARPGDSALGILATGNAE